MAKSTRTAITAAAGGGLVAAAPARNDTRVMMQKHAAPVAQALCEIQKIDRVAKFDFAMSVGRIVVEHIFAGDVNALRKRGPKDQTLRDLANHPELPITERRLYSAVSAYEFLQRTGLEEVVRTSVLLGFSHVQAVLPAPREDQKRLLVEAKEQAWTVRHLKAEVAKLARPRRGGRRPASPLTKLFTALEAAVAGIESALAAASEVDAETADHAVEIVKRASTGLSSIHRQLGGWVSLPRRPKGSSATARQKP